MGEPEVQLREEVRRQAAEKFISDRLVRSVQRDHFFRIMYPISGQSRSEAVEHMGRALLKVGESSRGLLQELKSRNSEAYDLVLDLGVETQNVEQIVVSQSALGGDFGVLYTNVLLGKLFQGVSEIHQIEGLGSEQKGEKFEELVNSGITILDTPLPGGAYPSAIKICTTMDKMMDIPEVSTWVDPAPQLTSKV